MRTQVKNIFISLALILGMVGVFGVTQPAYAVDCGKAENKTKPTCATQSGIKATGTEKTGCGTDGKSACGISDAVKTVINVLLFIIGAVSVIMIILGGIRYVLSNGDSNQVTAAKNTILYAVIGVIVALLAYAIVGFVVEQFN